MRPLAESEYAASRSRKSSAGDGISCRPTAYFLTRDPDTVEHSISSPLRSRQHDERASSRRRSTIKHVGGDRPVASQDLTPLSHDVSLPDSPRSVPKSAVSSLADDTDSQVIASSDEDEKITVNEQADRDSVPQLVMPSIRMPSRRPFTQRGQQLGRFRILIAGGRGCGRTSLIKSIIQLSDDIVHVDPITHAANSQSAVNEVYASSKPFPKWWSDLDSSRILRRRKSGGDLVLERNICFVDTTRSGRIDNTLAYIEQQFLRSINSIHSSDTELTNLISGRGGSQVDLVLYLTTKDTIKADIDNIRRLAQLASVIPLISKADLLTAEEVAEIKTQFSGVDGVLPKLPAFSAQDQPILASAPYCVSSLNGPDFDNMDASLLMSSEYVAPLLPSELPTLIDQIFDPNVVSYLRQLSAQKLVSWHNSEPKLTQPPASPSFRSIQPSTLNSPLSQSGVLVRVTSEVSLNTSNSYALAKVADHTQREEHLAQIRLCKWASELQLSLQRERERYENMARSERALWLVQRMGEEVRDGQIVPVTNHPSATATAAADFEGKPGRIMFGNISPYEVHDPLGLLRWQSTMQAQGWVVLQVVGSFGVIGGVAIWLARTWGWTTSLHGWAQHYGVPWFGHDP